MNKKTRNIKKLTTTLFIATLSCVFACQDENTDDLNLTKIEKVTGYVQKGPFISGSSITLSELKQDLTATGKNYQAQILDNQGTFEVKNIDLSSLLVELKANGFYFNEVTGENSAAQLTLLALSDLTDASSVNVNVLSHLEKNRVEYLMGEGYTFAEAKTQAQQEILALFAIEKQDIKNSELLDILQAGEDNAILLAASIILQGYRTEAELTELLANISADIKEDGMLHTASLGTELINDIRLIDLAKVRQNIEDRYAGSELEVTLPDFEKYIQHFINHTDYEVTNMVAYPSTGSYGPNLLSLSREEFPSRTEDDSLCSFTAILPEGASLRVGFYPEYTPTEPATDTSTVVDQYSDWVFAFREDSGWTFSDFNQANWSQEFYSTASGRKLELEFHLNGRGSAKLEIYENGSLEPTRIKNISW